MMRSNPPRRPAAPPAPSPGRSAAQRQREIATLLMRLDAMLKQSAELAQAARERVSVGGLARYRRFSRRVRDFFALAALAQERLDAAPEELEDLIGPMTTALERLHARMVVQFVEGSAAFFASFARVKALPIGTNEMCGVELRGVLEIRKFLDDPLYEGERGQALRAEADRITGLIRRVMDRIPPLPDFGDEPSIGPRGTVNSPLKGPNAHLPPGRAAGRPSPSAAPRPATPAPSPSTEVRSLSLDQFEDDEEE
ncbi:hypothetical protein VY88_07345 [Azospirillum thiophilum]|uniref:Uncharacterized protein n=1 Tax=Azospirillum thiophilum TaxID=528244 RepID=A0AAC8VW60_9PROT|nr:hypothetical protein [Azospirillum thiophilum]ALG70428.1 hypothetical protein AL072_05360 [Azospirillum thiophilum]KJR65893.1 hypothetical protein VY88_07345 [Azospirillum thiophilum]